MTLTPQSGSLLLGRHADKLPSLTLNCFSRRSCAAKPAGLKGVCAALAAAKLRSGRGRAACTVGNAVLRSARRAIAALHCRTVQTGRDGSKEDASPRWPG